MKREMTGASNAGASNDRLCRGEYSSAVEVEEYTVSKEIHEREGRPEDKREEEEKENEKCGGGSQEH